MERRASVAVAAIEGYALSHQALDIARISTGRGGMESLIGSEFGR
jgi:hypothetical protein